MPIVSIRHRAFNSMRAARKTFKFFTQRQGEGYTQYIRF